MVEIADGRTAAAAPTLRVRVRTGDAELTVAVARDLVSELAPEEAAIFGPISVAFLEGRGLTQAPRDEMLGSGGGEVIVPLSPVVLMVVGEVVLYLRTELAKAAARQTVSALEAMVRSLFRKFHSESAGPVPKLTREQLLEVRRLAYETARASGLQEKPARLLADATIGGLVVS
jgi:hypothetical protein